LTLSAEFSSSEPLNLREGELLASRLVREAWQFYEDRKDGILPMYSQTKGDVLPFGLSKPAGSKQPSEPEYLASGSTMSGTHGLPGTSWRARLQRLLKSLAGGRTSE
jgi:hypothetical protein